MTARQRLLVLLVSIPIVAFAARRQAPQSHDRMPMPDLNWTELMGSMDRMHSAMSSVKSSGNHDVDFVKLMLPHHQGAVNMARAELLYGQDSQMRRLAQEIVTDQESEIQLMQLWLTKHEPNSHDPTQTPGSDEVKEQ
jgi:uncharacterized protein (DUF305 family)